MEISLGNSFKTICWDKNVKFSEKDKMKEWKYEEESIEWKNDGFDFSWKLGKNLLIGQLLNSLTTESLT